MRKVENDIPAARVQIRAGTGSKVRRRKDDERTAGIAQGKRCCLRARERESGRSFESSVETHSDCQVDRCSRHVYMLHGRSRSCLTQPRRSCGEWVKDRGGTGIRVHQSRIFPSFQSLYCCQGLATIAHSGGETSAVLSGELCQSPGFSNGKGQGADSDISAQEIRAWTIKKPMFIHLYAKLTVDPGPAGLHA
jgi:hypothetical protein